MYPYFIRNLPAKREHYHSNNSNNNYNKLWKFIQSMIFTFSLEEMSLSPMKLYQILFCSSLDYNKVFHLIFVEKTYL